MFLIGFELAWCIMVVLYKIECVFYVIWFCDSIGRNVLFFSVGVIFGVKDVL